jgi:hypothetical protein
LTSIGITGHQDIPVHVRDDIERQVRAILEQASRHGGLVGVGCLAAGADQMFARCVLELGGALEVVVPCYGYEATFSDPADRQVHDALLAAATKVRRLPFEKPSEQAYMAAGVVVADECVLLVAVWDGQPAGGLGGTADVVEHARSIGRDVRIIWPAGVRRT